MGKRCPSSNILDFFVNTYEADIDKRSRQQQKAAASVTDDQTDLMRGPKRHRGLRPLHERVRYLESHPKYNSKYRIIRSQHHNTLPNFIGRYFPSRDDEDQRSFYYASMLTLLKPWRDLRTDLEQPSQTWEEASNVFCSTTSARNCHIISNIQYFHCCETAAKCEGFKLTTMQISRSRGGMMSEELELDEDVPHLTSDKFTEEGLAFLIASQRSWREELHACLAIEAAKSGRIFNDNMLGACLTVLGNGTDTEPGGSVWRAAAVDIDNLLVWKQQMERDVQKMNSAFSVMTNRDPGNSCNTATVTRNDSTGLAGVTYHDPENNTLAEASLPPIDPSMLKEDQYRAYDIITSHLDQTLSGHNPPPLRMLILGEWGTGKSKVIQTITEYFAHRGVVHILLKAAYTGAAASIVDGKTTHTIAMVSAGKDTSLSNESKAKLQQFWQHISYLVIDELSMLAKKFLALLSRNISIAKMVEGQPAKNESFGGINVILCGDFHQFPPVATSPTEALYFPSNPERDSAESQSGRAIYEEFTTVVILQEQMHVTDPVWHDFLVHLRNGRVKEEHISMLRTLVITNSNCPPTDFKNSPWDSASLVTPRHAVRRQWNEALRKFSSDAGKKIITCNAEDMIKGEPLTLRERYALVARGKNGREGWRKQRRLNQDLPESIDVAVGMKVMVTQNVETDLDITNGARGTIVGIILHPDEPMISNAEAQTVKLQRLPIYMLAKLDRTRATQLAGFKTSPSYQWSPRHRPSGFNASKRMENKSLKLSSGVSFQ